MLKLEAQGYYSWIVLNQKDKIVRYAKNPQRNLVLNQGLDGIAVRSWADSFVACAVGTGTSSPVKTQTGLDSESRRTVTYLDLQSANSTTLSGEDFILRRTFVFPQEGSDVTYTEAGFSYSATGPNALFSRVRLPNILVSSGQRIIIQYELVVTLSPTLSTSLINPISLPTSSSGSFQYQRVGLKGVNALGQTYNYDDAEACNEPSVAAKGFFSISSSVPATFGSVVDRTGTTLENSVSLSTYVSSSFARDKIFSVAQRQGLGTSWRSLGLGATSGTSYVKTGLVHVLNVPYVKTQGVLDIAFRFTWAVRAAQNYTTLYYWQDEEQTMLKKQNPLLHYFGQSYE